MADPKLPAGYWLDRVTDPDVLMLRRPNGSVVAVFNMWAATAEAIEKVANEDAEQDR
jgi:hypothetical protein